MWRRASVDHSAAGRLRRRRPGCFSSKAASVCPPPFLWSTDTQDDPFHQAILVPNAHDSDMTASMQRRPNPSSSRLEKKSQISSASDNRDSLSREHSTRDVRNIHDLMGQVRFRTRAQLSNVPTRCRKVYADCVNSCTALSVNDSLASRHKRDLTSQRTNLSHCQSTARDESYEYERKRSSALHLHL